MIPSEPLPYHKTNPMPVSSLVPIVTPEEGGALTLTVQTGGYYYSKKKEFYEIVRLIELRADSFHLQVLGHTNEVPTLEYVQSLTPVVWHVPLPLEYLFDAQFVYIGGAPLKEEDFKGYRVYRDQLEWYSTTTERRIKELLRESTQEPPAPATISYQHREVELRFG